ncbi:MAG: hypothetical protein PHH26_02240 [Candidatus Thermoplasmatota archaeon]|nr:hypothetical protein [Candidatus Thermoplasmatota archaeon]
MKCDIFNTKEIKDANAVRSGKRRFCLPVLAMILSFTFILASLSGCILDVSEGINSITGNNEETNANLLENPGFEEIDNGAPEEWFKACIASNGLSMYSDKFEKHGGARSACISNSYTYPEYNGNVYNNWGQTMYGAKVLIGKSIIISGWIRTEKVTSDGAFLMLQCWDNEYTTIFDQSTTSEAKGNSGWKYYKTSPMIVPQGTEMLLARAGLHGTGTAWFDDLKVTVVS